MSSAQNTASKTCFYASSIHFLKVDQTPTCSDSKMGSHPPSLTSPFDSPQKGVSLLLHFKFQKKKHSRFKPKVLQSLNFRDPVSVRSGTDLKFRKSRIPVFGQNAVLFCKFARNGVLTFGKSLSCATFCGDSEFLIRKLLSPRIPELSPKNRIFWNEMREVT